MRRLALVLLASFAGAACGASQGASTPAPSVDAGATDAGPPPCREEWSISEGGTSFQPTGTTFAVLAGGRTLFGGATNPRIVDGCGVDVGPAGQDIASMYYVDEAGALRAAFIGNSFAASWNGVALPLPRSDGAMVEYGAGGATARPFAFDDTLETAYPWRGRLEVSATVDATGATPRFRFVDNANATAWTVSTETIPGSAARGTIYLSANASFAVAAFAAPEVPRQATSRFRFDAVSRDGRSLWQYIDTSWGTGSVVDVGAGGDVSLLDWALPGRGRTLVRLDSNGSERWRVAIATDDFAESGKFTVSTAPSGRTLVAATAYRGGTLCGKRVSGPGGVETSADGSKLEGVVIGVNANGTCAFVRVYDGARHRSSLVGARFVTDDDVRILWDDADAPFEVSPFAATGNLERVRWDTLVARFGVNAP